MSIFSNGSVETDPSVTRSSILLDTDIETDVCALGITEKYTSAALVMEEKKTPTPMIHDKAGNVPACETQQKHQLFDFVHIRYQRSGIQDGVRLFRLAFEQTKPGGWIEVVETGAVSAPALHARQQQFTRTAAAGGPKSRTCTRMIVAPMLTPDNSAAWIKRQLLEAGFVDVEEKGQRLPSSTAGICYRIAGIGKYLKSWCLGFLGVRWNCDSSLIDEKDSSSIHTSPKVFVIARRP